MKQFFKYFFALAILISTSVAFVSCSKDDEPKSDNLAGTWVYSNPENGYSVTLKLNSNHTGTVSQNLDTRASISLTEQISWTTTQASSSVKYLDIIHLSGDYVLTDEDEPATSYVYILAGKQLSLGSLVFQKQ